MEKCDTKNPEGSCGVLRPHRGGVGANASMSTTKKRKAIVTTSDAEIEAAIARANLYDEKRPKAVAVSYLRTNDLVKLELANGVTMLIPRRLMQGLQNADAADVARVELVDLGSSLHWPTLDVDHYVPGLCEGVLGTRKWMASIAGAKGGAARTPAKVQAARLNGQKGGRPKSPEKAATVPNKAASGMLKVAATRKSAAGKGTTRRRAAAAKGRASHKASSRKSGRRR
jgi:hypothetical protein